MKSSQPLVDERGAAFGRFASRVVEALNEAIAYRRAQGESIASIAGKIGCHKSVVSRVLNGTTRNPTLRTVSDILWAANFEPRDFEAEPVEQISPNWVMETSEEFHSNGNAYIVYPTKTVNFDEEVRDFGIGMVFREPEIEVTAR